MSCIVQDCNRPSTVDADECFEHLEEWRAEQRRRHPRVDPPAWLIVERVDGAREGWVCSDCDPNDIVDDGQRDGVVAIVGTLEAKRPVCAWHRDEAIHEAIPDGSNCRRCGIEHAALWPLEA